MKIREKIILFCMFLVILYGAYSFFIESKKKQTDDSHKQKPVSDFIAGISAELAGSNFSQEDIYILARVAEPWINQPFIKTIRKNPAAAKEGEGEGEKDYTPEEAVFRYSGFITVKGKIISIINGMEFIEGEFIDPRGYRLKKASAESVVISKAGRPDITVQLDDNEAVSYQPKNVETKKRNGPLTISPKPTITLR